MNTTDLVKEVIKTQQCNHAFTLLGEVNNNECRIVAGSNLTAISDELIAELATRIKSACQLVFRIEIKVIVFQQTKVY